MVNVVHKLRFFTRIISSFLPNSMIANNFAVNAALLYNKRLTKSNDAFNREFKSGCHFILLLRAL